MILTTRWTHTDPAFCRYGFTLCVDHETVHSPPIGSSFVDVGLKVLVRQKAGTVMAFQPDFLPGTTLTNAAINKGVAICFSRRVGEAWQEAKKRDGGASVIAAAGADMEVE